MIIRENDEPLSLAAYAILNESGDQARNYHDALELFAQAAHVIDSGMMVFIERDEDVAVRGGGERWRDADMVEAHGMHAGEQSGPGPDRTGDQWMHMINLCGHAAPLRGGKVGG